MSADTVALQSRVQELENQLSVQGNQHIRELRKLEEEVQELRRLAQELEDQNRSLDVVGRNNSADTFLRRVEWTISNFSQKQAELPKGQALWSPKFCAGGMRDVKLEFFPNGRETTTYEGFCSMFLWCPPSVRIKYQLWVGSFVRAPDEDEYNSRIGHGHSNFCPVAPEVDRENDCVRVGVDFLEVSKEETVSSRGIQLISTSLEAMVARESEVLRNSSVNRVCWKISHVSERLKQFPRGSSMWSPVFTAAGIREILLEFYPNGSVNTTKDGFCAFYVRCAEGVSMVVTLFVGKVRKGPIKTTFDSGAGKGLPDFCLVEEEIDGSDSLDVGIEVTNQPNKTLSLET